MGTRLVLLLAILLISILGVNAQFVCKCENAGGTAAAACPDGYIALCTCSAVSCNSRCVKAASAAPRHLDMQAFVAALKGAAATNIGDIVSKSLGKTVTFETPVKNFKFEYASSKIGASSHWDVLEALSSKGKLLISGHDIGFWKAQRDDLLSGGELAISIGGGTAQAFVNEISFITGKRFTITSGDKNALISAPVTGKGLSGLLQSLNKTARVTVVEN